MKKRMTFAPGARVVIRDEEWLVRSTLPTSTGSTAVRVVGLSELARNYEAVFLSDLDRMKELRPEETLLVTDDSSRYRRSRLYLESLLRRTPPTDERLYLGHRGAFNFTPYQMTPAHLALNALRPRILIADGVGLGKTIEAGILLTELIKRGHGNRILVVALRSMLAQFQQEMWARFAIPLVRLDSVGLRRVRAKIPSNKNPFYYYNRVIISIDTLKNDAQYRHYLEQSHWDVIVIDECHNVANAGSQRHRLANLLARTCDSLILTSATPHNGQPESFANLINMLDSTAIADVHDYTAEEIEGLFVRRFKKDIEDQVRGQFSERTVTLEEVQASPAEERFFDRLADARFTTLHRSGAQDALYRVGLLKSFLSSPAACVLSIEGRLTRIEKHIERLTHGDVAGDERSAAVDQTRLLDDPLASQKRLNELRTDFTTLSELHDLAFVVDDAAFSKYRQLVQLLRDLGADASPQAERIIIFSERIATLHYLQERLMQEFGADEEAIVVFHAGLPDVEQQTIVEDFGKADSPKRILLASDVASEGVNLHYYCHLMVHFDIPWSLITMEQRNGRIDRYGQHQPPQITYLLTRSCHPVIRGDLRILDRLIQKEQEAHKNIGDAATLLGLYDARKEEEYILQQVAMGAAPEQIIPDEPEDEDWLAILMGEDELVRDDETGILGEYASLYEDDLAFARAAFEELHDSNQIDQMPEFHPQRPEFTLTANEDLRRRCEFMPREAIPEDWAFRLTTDRDRVMQAMDEARKRQHEWPQEQLFWDIHPVTEWLLDKLLVRFGRHEAPIILTPELGGDDIIILFQGILSNRRGQPVIAQWFGLYNDEDRGWLPVDLETSLELTGFRKGVPNAGQPADDLKEEIAALLPGAVEAAREYMLGLRTQRARDLRKRLQDDMRRLKRWHQRRKAMLEAEMAKARGSRLANLRHELEETEKIYQSREKWLNDTFSTEANPYLRIGVVFTGE